MGTVARWVYWVARGILYMFLRICFRWRVEGREHIPARGPLILFSNHASWYDIPVLGCSCPRLVRFMAKAELFRNKVLGAALRTVGAFPVHRGEADRAAIRQALAILADGGVLGIFPEGTRVRAQQLGKAEPGVAYLAYKSRAPVVPMGISSPYRLFGPILVRIGPPIHLDQQLGERPSSAQLAAASQQLMEQVRDLLVPELLHRTAESR